MQEFPNQEVEFVQPENVNAGPFSAHGDQEDGQVMEGELDIKGRNQGRELVNEMGLCIELVGVPDAVEEALPELLHEIF